MIPELLFASVVAIALPVRAWRRRRRGAPPAHPARYLTETLLLTAALVWLLRRHEVPLRAIGLRSDLPVLRDVAIGLAVIAGLDGWAVWRITRRLRNAAVVPVSHAKAAGARAGRPSPFSFVAVVVVGSAWEELCFRATVLLLVPHTLAGLSLGIAAGSLVFGVQHLRDGAAAVAYTCGLGVLFSWLYVATGDLIAVIIVHAAANILTVVQWVPRIERARREPLRPQTPMFLG